MTKRAIRGKTVKHVPVVPFKVAWLRWFDHSDRFEHGLRLQNRVPVDDARRAFEANVDRWLDEADGFVLAWLPPMAAVLGVKLPPRAKQLFKQQLPEIADEYATDAADWRALGYEGLAEDETAELAKTCSYYGVSVPGEV